MISATDSGPVIGNATALRGSVSLVHVAGLLGILGGTLAIVGAGMPWLSFFAGLQSVSGLSGPSGWAIAALGATAASGSVVGWLHRPLTGRWITGLAGFGVLAVGGWAGVNLLSAADAFAQDPLLVSAIGPGLAVALIGGALAFASLFAPLPADSPGISAASLPTRFTPGRIEPRRLGLALALASAGIVHLALAPEHARESLVLGAGFVAAGLVQLPLGALALLRQRTDVLVSSIAVNVILVAAYVVAVTVGLPGGDHGVGAAPAHHGALGHVERIDAVGLLTVFAEVSAVVLAAHLLRRRGSRPEARTPQRDG